MITFYLIICLLIVDFIVFVNDRYITSAVGLLLIGAGAWYLIPEFNAFIDQHNWIYLAGWYLGIGTVIALVKWVIVNITHYSKLKKAAAEFQKRTHEYSSAQARYLGFAKFWNNCYYNRNSTDPRAPDYAQTLYNSQSDIIDVLTIRARDHADRIAGWIFQWPFVVIATAFEDLVINLGKHIATLIDLMFNKFSRAFVASSLRDL